MLANKNHRMLQPLISPSISTASSCRVETHLHRLNHECLRLRRASGLKGLQLCFGWHDMDINTPSWVLQGLTCLQHKKARLKRRCKQFRKDLRLVIFPKDEGMMKSNSMMSLSESSRAFLDWLQRSLDPSFFCLMRQQLQLNALQILDSTKHVFDCILQVRTAENLWCIFRGPMQFSSVSSGPWWWPQNLRC